MQLLVVDSDINATEKFYFLGYHEVQNCLVWRCKKCECDFLTNHHIGKCAVEFGHTCVITCAECSSQEVIDIPDNELVFEMN